MHKLKKITPIYKDILYDYEMKYYITVAKMIMTMHWDIFKFFTACFEQSDLQKQTYVHRLY